ncbi:MAG TPA: aminotransferase class IV [Bacteroidales bacterium]|nr:aminotransferase class IV [Bacteroidales bacterium]
MNCFINDGFVPYSEARIHISDLGLQRGFSIFDYFIAIGDKIPFFDDYLDRFFYSAEKLSLRIPLAREALKDKVFSLLDQNKPERSGIKLLLTGGYSDDLYTPEKPNFLILNLPLKFRPDDFIGGVKLMLLDYYRFNPEVKTTYYLPSLAMLPEMKKQGVVEMLYHHNGLVSETTRSNLFLVKNKTLITPAEGILKGIIRKHLLKVAGAMMKTDVRPVKLGEIFEADEILISGTSKHVAPVIAIGDVRIGNGQPGTITRGLADAFRQYYLQQLK